MNMSVVHVTIRTYVSDGIINILFTVLSPFIQDLNLIITIPWTTVVQLENGWLQAGLQAFDSRLQRESFFSPQHLKFLWGKFKNKITASEGE